MQVLTIHDSRCRRYIDDEIQARDIDSPFRVDGAIIGLFNALLTLREEGKGITKMIASVEMLAQANSRRGALASALLPPLHWVMLASLAMLLLSAFLLFDSDFSNPVGENRIIFAVLAATLVSILQARSSKLCAHLVRRSSSWALLDDLQVAMMCAFDVPLAAYQY
jgi:hypothetical protein